MKTLRFIDLFSGIGGIRKGFELACSNRGIVTECVFSSEIKPAALKVFHQNHPTEDIAGDITVVDEKSVPDFDVCLAGFPCQAFSSAGKRLGFMDTRGTLFFDVERILREKKLPVLFSRMLRVLLIMIRLIRQSLLVELWRQFFLI